MRQLRSVAASTRPSHQSRGLQLDWSTHASLEAQSLLFVLCPLFVQVEKRGSEVDGKIKQLDEELLRYKTQLSKMRPGPAKNQVQQRALRVLKQKKMYDKQRDTLYNQSFNVDQTRFALQNVKDTVTTVAAMKSASKELKVGMKEIKM